MARSEIYIGPMFARKTQAIEGRLEDATIADETILVMRPKVDNRVERTIFTRISGNHILANYPKLHMVDIESEVDFWTAVQKYPAEIVAIDECQFGDKLLEYPEQEVWFAKAIQKLLDQQSGNDSFLVLMAGLDTTYERKGFGPVPYLVCEVADKVLKLKAICNKCKKKTAIYTYRTIESSEEVVVGGQNIYQARCRRCWPSS